jgi:hypothetical protein
MSRQRPSRADLRVENYFGGCPRCGECDGFLNIGSNHWCVCHKHKVAWCFGANLLSGWKDETYDRWRKNADLLATYREVEPLPCNTFEEYRLVRDRVAAGLWLKGIDPIPAWLKAQPCEIETDDPLPF